MHIELYHYWRSSCSWRVRWALGLKQVTYSAFPVNLLKGEHLSEDFLALNPSGLVPALKVDGKDLTESLSILEWLEESFPAKPLLPSEPMGRAEVRELAYRIACGIQPVQNLRVMQYYSPDPKVRAEYARHWISKGFEALEARLSTTAGTYAYGNQLTIADLCLVPQVYNALRFQVDISQYPAISRVNENCLSGRECQLAAPHNQQGAQAQEP